MASRLSWCAPFQRRARTPRTARTCRRTARAALQLVHDLLLGGLLEQAVAGGAACPGPEVGCVAQHVTELVIGPGAVDERARPQLAAAQQPPVAAEHHATFGGGARGEGRVADVLAAALPDPRQAQSAREGAEVDVEEEAQAGRREPAAALDRPGRRRCSRWPPGGARRAPRGRPRRGRRPRSAGRRATRLHGRGWRSRRWRPPWLPNDACAARTSPARRRRHGSPVRSPGQDVTPESRGLRGFRRRGRVPGRPSCGPPGP